MPYIKQEDRDRLNSILKIDGLIWKMQWTLWESMKSNYTGFTFYITNVRLNYWEIQNEAGDSITDTHRFDNEIKAEEWAKRWASSWRSARVLIRHNDE